MYKLAWPPNLRQCYVTDLGKKKKRWTTFTDRETSRHHRPLACLYLIKKKPSCRKKKKNESRVPTLCFLSIGPVFFFFLFPSLSFLFIQFWIYMCYFHRALQPNSCFVPQPQLSANNVEKKKKRSTGNTPTHTSKQRSRRAFMTSPSITRCLLILTSFGKQLSYAHLMVHII